MSLKGVELQIAIPKTFDAGKMADQHHQRTINQQLDANEALKREIERKQLAVNTSEGMDAIDEEDENDASNNGQTSNGKNKKKKQQQEQDVHHPFKGNLFDFSG
ncbi:RNA polymerase subunit sigma [Solibacillus sp. FSL K6-1523]|uniref:RNA polymerase subunit sigma n=1 Tax=Solibacillus sp. FSL K6-1523 TaxID=2921471 RepID=UPI0030F509DA